jgi:molybdate-binding protein/DNA-binding XRE family transcriptional regulator
MAPLRSHVRELRQRAGLQQQELAARVGISRQSLSAVEAGTVVPSTAVALAIARMLGCRVEDLFVLAGQDAPLTATLAPSAVPTPAPGSRVRLGQVRDAWIAHGLDGDDPAAATTPADGILGRAPRRGRAAVRPLRAVDALRANLLVAGCDPALGLLAGHLGEGSAGLRLHWIPAASGAALEAFAHGLVHVAGIHLFDARTGEHNLPAVRARLQAEPGMVQPLVVVNLAAWEEGFVVAPRRRVRRAADLLAPGIRVVLREPGSGAYALLERTLAEAGIPLSRLAIAETARGHHAVAQAIAAGRADAGIATAAAAAASGLDFVPLAEDRFDLVLLADSALTPSGQRLMETLASGRFKRDIGALPGYATARTGQVVARLAEEAA